VSRVEALREHDGLMGVIIMNRHLESIEHCMLEDIYK
jgi:hypothetical protein